MAQFVAYANTNRAKEKIYPYLLDIQSDLLADLQTTVVIPLSPKSLIGSAVISKLCPVLVIGHNDYVALTQQIAGVDRKVLGKEKFDLSIYRSEIVAALDFIISGI
jgi:toxin CcdB